MIELHLISDATTDVTQAAQSNPVVLYAVIAGLVLVVLASTILPKLRESLASMRRIASDRDDADLAQMRRQIEHLVTTVDDMRRRQAAHDEVLTVHRRWDVSVVNDPEYATRNAPPPLYPITRTPNYGG